MIIFRIRILNFLRKVRVPICRIRFRLFYLQIIPLIEKIQIQKSLSRWFKIVRYLPIIQKYSWINLVFNLNSKIPSFGFSLMRLGRIRFWATCFGSGTIKTNMDSYLASLFISCWSCLANSWSLASCCSCSSILLCSSSSSGSKVSSSSETFLICQHLHTVCTVGTNIVIRTRYERSRSTRILGFWTTSITFQNEKRFKCS